MDKRIGILVYRGDKGYGNPAFLRRLVEEGTSMGVEVFVFSPQDVDRIFHQIRGYEPYGAGWKWRWREWPDIVIDYYRYYPLAKHRHYLPIREGSIFRFANNRFANKFRVHQILEQEPEVYQWLPETVPFSKKNLSDMIKSILVCTLSHQTALQAEAFCGLSERETAFFCADGPKSKDRRTRFCRTQPP
ncbi:hypothetical protein M4D70_04665 [Brevibacillus borstelensis]|nr:YheC/YheD family protein [Brevibacillus borstelensis]MCC0565542.1 hypothetical protein [Brevibacillus borstelensis]MCM3468879.1 hypothetical protein [Brevibacillus borstelensis]MCM3621553.1 hypothetical protein [Brevibacillus borstelensis]